jgi:hypothetical protein
MTRYERLRREILAEDRRVAALPCTCENNSDLCPSCNAKENMKERETVEERYAAIEKKVFHLSEEN